MNNTNPNDSERATYIKGEHDGRIGARSRITQTGRMSTSGAALAEAKALGLPPHIRGNPILGCGCIVGHLSAVGKIMPNGEIEADYRCDVRWHNYVVFQLKVKRAPSENEVRIDKNGNLVTDTGKDYQAPGLEAY